MSEPTPRQTIELGEYKLVIDLSSMTVQDWYDFLCIQGLNDFDKSKRLIDLICKIVGDVYLTMPLIYMQPVMNRVLQELTYLFAPTTPEEDDDLDGGTT